MFNQLHAVMILVRNALDMHIRNTVRQLPPEFELSFSLRQNLPSTSGTNTTTKPRSTHIDTYGRVITGDQV